MERIIGLVAAIVGILAAVWGFGTWVAERREESRLHNVQQTEFYLVLLDSGGGLGGAKERIRQIRATYTTENKPLPDSLEHQSFILNAKKLAHYYSELWKCLQDKCEWSVISSSECRDAVELFEALIEFQAMYGHKKAPGKTPWEKLTDRCKR